MRKTKADIQDERTITCRDTVLTWTCTVKTIICLSFNKSTKKMTNMTKIIKQQQIHSDPCSAGKGHEDMEECCDYLLFCPLGDGCFFVLHCHTHACMNTFIICTWSHTRPLTVTYNHGHKHSHWRTWRDITIVSHIAFTHDWGGVILLPETFTGKLQNWEIKLTAVGLLWSSDHLLNLP